MKLGEGVEAAIHCAAMLAGVDGAATMPGAAMAEAFGVSPSYLLKHLNMLTAAGILESVPGPAGGYRLAKPSERITLLDIVLAVEGREPAFRCGEIRQRGPVRLDASAYVKPCGINAAMLKAERAYRAALAEVRLSAIVADYVSEADPRSVAAGCAFVARYQRPQKVHPNQVPPSKSER
ncbi:MAG: Rrf2 family transcriptional regulator [Mesorhizobium sp.]|uniref:RrF2 family transcriptional regulator n=1 Tax=Mesorhizobium sp. TaxID=1871066 RepID=UPI000FD4DC8C|nr:Rrf2 family transcriptional regulator [Mesorhizobium sp.]RVC59598.1 Rrf2 family transcriptional regulator [Mesorhizobium sp. M4B.F.Ca.ET.088.02.2.1]RWF31733.1 MAG: Rrf2 family transcriptional regulator [Mesorhizobium sp.]RWF39694.1 MAG: Rrf2 family transcriptional regulator [Mesorhizobium sp.]